MSRYLQMDQYWNFIPLFPHVMGDVVLSKKFTFLSYHTDTHVIIIRAVVCAYISKVILSR